MPRISSNAPPALTAVRASGSIRLSQRRKRRHPWRAQRGRLRTSSQRCARIRANALRCSKTLPAFLFLARDALLQACAPFASRMADASGTYIGISDDWRIQSRVTLAPINMLNAQGTRSEEESVPRQGRCGPSGHGWLKRLSDLTVFSSQARTHSNIVLQHPTRPISPAEILIHFCTDEKNPVFSDRFLKMVGERGLHCSASSALRAVAEATLSRYARLKPPLSVLILFLQTKKNLSFQTGF